MLGRAVRAHHRDALRGRAFRERDRNRRAAEADPMDPRRVLGGEAGVVDHAREEHRRARARADVSLEHDLAARGWDPSDR